MTAVLDVVVARSDDMSEAALQRLYSALPVDRRRRCDAYHRDSDRRASAVSFALLQYLWRERSEAPMPALERGERGKPRLTGRHGIEFNLSHDASICVCALDHAPVGVDVQSRIPFDEHLFSHIAAPTETRLRDRLRREDDMSFLWSRKEALLKRSGQGITVALRGVDTVGAADLVTLVSDEVGARISLSAAGVDARALDTRGCAPPPRPAPHCRVRLLRLDAVGAWTARLLAVEVEPAAAPDAAGVRTPGVAAPLVGGPAGAAPDARRR